MRLIDPDEVIKLTPEQIRLALRRRLDEGPRIAPYTLALPARGAVADRIDLKTLSALGADFDGIRLFEYAERMVRPYGVLERREGKVLWRRPLKPDAAAAIAEQFLTGVESAAWWLMASPAVVVFGATPEIGYTLDEILRLITATFAAPQKPRLIPRFLFPNPEDVAAAVKGTFGAAPWTFEDVNESWEISADGAGFVVVNRGERGEIQLREERPTFEAAAASATAALLTFARLGDPAEFVCPDLQL